ncbi:unnamed protein product [Musa banksii]
MGSEVRANGESRVGCLGPDPSRRRTMGFVPRLVSRLCFQIFGSRESYGSLRDLPPEQIRQMNLYLQFAFFSVSIS